MVTLMALTTSAHPSVPAHEYYGNTELHASSHSDEPVKEVPKETPKQHRIIHGNVSWYTAAEGGAITSTGHRCVAGYTVANDSLPPGTKVKILDHIFTVDDCFGGGYDETRFDVYCNSVDEAMRNGRQYVEVEVIE